MDSRFSIAVYLLVLIHVTDEVLSSSQMAAMIGTDPTFIRKNLILLKSADLIDSHQGRKGFALRSDPKDINLFEIYKAVYVRDEVDIFRKSRNSNRRTNDQREVAGWLSDVYETIDRSIGETLASITLAQCIENMRNE